MSRLEKILSLALLVAVSLLAVQSVPTIRAWLPSIVAPAAKDVPIVVVHESDQGGIPPYASGAVEELRKAGRTVYVIDDDVVTGLGTPPKPVAPAIEPGRKIMGGSEGKGQALVLLSGETVLKAIELPKSKEAILEACR